MTSAAALEHHLGDPFDPCVPVSFARAVELDEREALPDEALAALDAWGLPAFYIPVEQGGRLGSMEECLSLIRVVARRDYTVAVAHLKTYLGSIAVWLSGSSPQRSRLAARIAQGEAVALALTERSHGSDLLANEVEGVKVAGGYLLHGEKWLINNASRASLLCVYARTSPEGGPRGYSLFLADKQELDARAFRELPKIRTHGIRGADISGIRFDRCFVADAALVGDVGGGLETTLRAFQVTRTLIAGLSLGAADTALRVTARFAARRSLYGAPIASIPHVRRQLAGAFADLLACECVAWSAARALHAAPHQMSVWSAVAKYVVPIVTEWIVRDLAVVLGARHYLREEADHGVFQKVMRDNAIASLFDGSTIVNLHAIIQQLGQLVRHRTSEGGALSPAARVRLAEVFDLRHDLPPFDPSQLGLSSRGRDDVLGGLDEAAAEIERLPLDDSLTGETRERLIVYARLLLDRRAAMDRRVLAQGSSYGQAHQLPAEWFDLAGHYCALAAATACLRMWLHNRGWAGGFVASGTWLVLALHRLLQRLPCEAPAPPAAAAERCVEEVMTLVGQERMFSLAPLPLGRRDRGTGPCGTP